MTIEEKKGRTRTLESGKRYARVRDADGRIVEVFTVERIPNADADKEAKGIAGGVKKFVAEGTTVYEAPAGSISGKFVADVPEIQKLIDGAKAEAAAKAEADKAKPTTGADKATA